MKNRLKISFAKAVSAIGLLTYTLGASASYGYLQEVRCQLDRGPVSSADLVQARLDWAHKCYPDLMEAFNWALKAAENTYDFAGTNTIVYPVFGTINADRSLVVLAAPVDAAAPCDSLEKQAPAGLQIKLIGFCGMGCLTPDQVVKFGTGSLPIGSVEAVAQSHVVTLGEGSQLGALNYMWTPLHQIVSDAEPTEQDILVFKTQFGLELKVTENHPLVDGQGVIRRADQLKVGESLVSADGSSAQILTIEKQKYFGKVYNLRIESRKIEGNIYLAQGYLSGSIAIQNEHVDYINRKLLRKGDLLDLEGI